MLTLIASIGGFIPKLLGKDVTYKTARVLGFILLAILLVAILSLGKCAYDASIINQHEAEERAEKAERQRDAERKANEKASADATALATTEAKLDQALADAAKKNPTEAAKHVGPVSQSYYDTLRENRR